MRWSAEGKSLALGHFAPEAGDGAKKHQVERELGILQGGKWWSSCGRAASPGTLILMAEPDVLQVYSTAIMVF